MFFKSAGATLPTPVVSRSGVVSGTLAHVGLGYPAGAVGHRPDLMTRHIGESFRYQDEVFGTVGKQEGLKLLNTPYAAGGKGNIKASGPVASFDAAGKALHWAHAAKLTEGRIQDGWTADYEPLPGAPIHVAYDTTLQVKGGRVVSQTDAFQPGFSIQHWADEFPKGKPVPEKLRAVVAVNLARAKVLGPLDIFHNHHAPVAF